MKSEYLKVLRFTGANDRGIDIAGFADEQFLDGVWDNYQCKHYDKPIPPAVAWPEIGKILWHSFNGHYKPPRAYYFVAPRGTGTSLTQYLANPSTLKPALLKAWDKNVKDAITTTQPILLEGDFAAYVDRFDFSIFKPVSVREIIEQHRQSPYFIGRFGGGLPARPKAEGAPDEIGSHESVYVGRLLEAYADHTKEALADVAGLKKWDKLDKHFQRQRESFYGAEALRVFFRDKVEPGTFESLQEEIYEGVVDTHDKDHLDGYHRVMAVTEVAQALQIEAHPLASCTFPRDRRGICHQLANEDRLKWTK
ncbi:ABC-three component system protein [Microvirga mediterraneensis]|uniref:ABC-three component system protein n=1 Tax=Microvirga mediterraneensis TaxID=2754695 RepID=UPI001FE9CA51|nr:ABC-three component system protein [Microvirga mediterraneensis]